MVGPALDVTGAIYPTVILGQIIIGQILCSHHWNRSVHLSIGVLGYKEGLCHQFFISPLAFPSSVCVPTVFIVLCIQLL